MRNVATPPEYIPSLGIPATHRVRLLQSIERALRDGQVPHEPAAEPDPQWTY
jgi:hypothetical protein